MGNPQCEDGYTKIANELLDALSGIRIPGEAMQVFLVIIRKTYGYGKKEDMIALSQFAITGISKPHIIRAIKHLADMNLIIAEKGNKIITTFCINKHYRQWKPLPKKATLPIKATKVPQKGNPALPKKEPTKETITKEKRKIRPPSGDHQIFTYWWYMAFKKVYEKDYVGSPSADGAIIKGLLAKVNLKTLLYTASAMFISEDKFYSENCIDIKFFKSQFDRINTKEISGKSDYLRGIGIAPPLGVTINDWKFWENGNESSGESEKPCTG